MLQDMRMGHFDTVIVWKLDRLGRSLQHLLQLLSEFQNQKIRLICTDMNFDTDTPQGKFFFSVVGAFAELEREITGRPPGKKDTKPRRKSGYYQRWLEKRMRT
jgi:DNA invertase Pin-like site-specific DNA recombinase